MVKTRKVLTPSLFTWSLNFVRASSLTETFCLDSVFMFFKRPPIKMCRLILLFGLADGVRSKLWTFSPKKKLLLSLTSDKCAKSQWMFNNWTLENEIAKCSTFYVPLCAYELNYFIIYIIIKLSFINNKTSVFRVSTLQKAQNRMVFYAANRKLCSMKKIKLYVPLPYSLIINYDRFRFRTSPLSGK